MMGFAKEEKKLVLRERKDLKDEKNIPTKESKSRKGSRL